MDYSIPIILSNGMIPYMEILIGKQHVATSGQ